MVEMRRAGFPRFPPARQFPQVHAEARTGGGAPTA
jgi:hypothetical protein